MILIDIEMPKCCFDCPCHNSEHGTCNLLKQTTYDLRPAICPMKEVGGEPKTDDYIKRVDAIMWNPESKDRREYGTLNLDDAYETGYEDKIKQIEQIPAAEVRENVRGEWTERKDIYPHKPDGEMTSWGYRCSCCNQLAQLKYNFCTNCGADMRGGGANV